MQHFDDYQLYTDTTAVYPREIGLPYAALGMIGEVGEYAEKLLNIVKTRPNISPSYQQIAAYDQFKEILAKAAQLSKDAESLKKALRERKLQMPHIVLYSVDERSELVDELGDVIHYTAREARHLNVEMSEVVYQNVKKTGSRKQRGVIQGNGDHR